MACAVGMPEAARWLAEFGEDVAAVDNFGRNARHFQTSFDLQKLFDDLRVPPPHVSARHIESYLQWEDNPQTIITASSLSECGSGTFSCVAETLATYSHLTHTTLSLTPIVR